MTFSTVIHFEHTNKTYELPDFPEIEQKKWYYFSYTELSELEKKNMYEYVNSIIKVNVLTKIICEYVIVKNELKMVIDKYALDTKFIFFAYKNDDDKYNKIYQTKNDILDRIFKLHFITMYNGPSFLYDGSKEYIKKYSGGISDHEYETKIIKKIASQFKDVHNIW